MPDREKYIEILSKTVKTVKKFNEDTPIKISLVCIEDILELLKEQEKAGTWKQIDDDTNIWSCSECDEPFILMDGTPIENKYYYCPQCGAKMKGR